MSTDLEPIEWLPVRDYLAEHKPAASVVVVVGASPEAVQLEHGLAHVVPSLNADSPLGQIVSAAQLTALSRVGERGFARTLIKRDISGKRCIYRVHKDCQLHAATRAFVAERHPRAKWWCSEPIRLVTSSERLDNPQIRLPGVPQTKVYTTRMFLAFDDLRLVAFAAPMVSV